MLAMSCLPLGRQGIVHSVAGGGLSRRRLLDLGLVPGTRVEALRRSPSGDPTAYAIRGAVIALRTEEANNVQIYLP
ncbi:MAG: FeoA family protein [Limnochordia bacterium]|jgi:ferrous iron transport protein A